MTTRSKGALRRECIEDATLGARWDPLLLTELPSLDDDRDRSERRSSSSAEIRSNSLSSTYRCVLPTLPGTGEEQNAT